jgi:hypothetical protein
VHCSAFREEADVKTKYYGTKVEGNILIFAPNNITICRPIV